MSKKTERACKVCGCTEFNACMDSIHGACWWVGPNLCSHCDMAAKQKLKELQEAKKKNG